MGFFDKLHKTTKWADPLGHLAVDGIHKTSTLSVREGSRAVKKMFGEGTTLGDLGAHWQHMADKDYNDFDRWAGNTALAAAAVYGGMAAGGAMGGGAGAGAAGSTGAGITATAPATGYGLAGASTGAAGISAAAPSTGYGLAGASTAGPGLSATTAGSTGYGLTAGSSGAASSVFDWSKLLKQAGRQQGGGKSSGAPAAPQTSSPYGPSLSQQPVQETAMFDPDNPDLNSANQEKKSKEEDKKQRQALLNAMLAMQMGGSTGATSSSAQTANALASALGGYMQGREYKKGK